MSVSVTAFIITLKTNSRIREIEKTIIALSLIGIKIIFFDAVDAKQISYTKQNETTSEMSYENDKILIANQCLSNTKMLGGVRACSWSHIKIYKKIIDENNDKMKYLIFEDDAWFNSDIPDFIKLFKNVINNVPENYDLCHLGDSYFRPFYKKNKINDYFYDIYTYPINNAHAYLISINGAKKILDYCKDTITQPPDTLIASCLQFVENFTFYIPENPLFIQKQNIPSIITGVLNK